MNIIKFENIYKKYDKTMFIDNVSFEVKKGEITTLIGPNGAGKTTIAKLILGLEPPTKGKIIIDRTLKMGYVPQKLNLNNNFPITTEKFLLLIAPNHDVKNNFLYSDFLNLNEVKNKDISHLSLGQLQKLLIIATLLNNPDIIILDEPIQSLDVISQQRFYELIEEIKDKTTFFIISHDLFTVMKNSDQVICLNGHICCSGRPNEKAMDQTFIDTVSSLSLYNHKHDHSHN